MANPQNLRPPWKKGQTGNPRGRPAEPWKKWLHAQEGDLREQLVTIARDKRTRPETRARIMQYFLDQTHGRAKESLEVENSGPVVVFTPQPIVEWMDKMRKRSVIPDDKDNKDLEKP